jgi:hypothetical protein
MAGIHKPKEITWETKKQMGMDNTEPGLNGTVCEDVDWIHLFRDKVQLRAVVNTEMNSRFPQSAGNFLTRSATISFSNRKLLLTATEAAKLNLQGWWWAVCCFSLAWPIILRHCISYLGTFHEASHDCHHRESGMCNEASHLRSCAATGPDRTCVSEAPGSLTCSCLQPTGRERLRTPASQRTCLDTSNQTLRVTAFALCFLQNLCATSGVPL